MLSNTKDTKNKSKAQSIPMELAHQSSYQKWNMKADLAVCRPLVTKNLFSSIYQHKHFSCDRRELNFGPLVGEF